MSEFFHRRKASNNTAAAAAAPASANVGDAAGVSSITLSAKISSTSNKGAGISSNILSSSRLLAARSWLSSSACPSPHNADTNHRTVTTSVAPYAATSTTPIAYTRTCHSCQGPISRTICHINCPVHGKQSLHFHPHCFVCLHCNAQIDPQSQECFFVKVLSGKKRTTATAKSRDHVADETSDNNDDKLHPFHNECFARHFGYMCVVCEKPLPIVDTAVANSNEDTHTKTVKCIKHKFFDTERMCPHHATTLVKTTTTQKSRQKQSQQLWQSDQQDSEDDDAVLGTLEASPKEGIGIKGINGSIGNVIGAASSNGNITTSTTASKECKIVGSIRQCMGCHRLEPLLASSTKHFVDVGNSNPRMCLCLACMTTVVLTSDDVVPLWHKVVDFFEGPLGLITSQGIGYNDINCGVTRQDLMKIPILAVGMEALNENIRSENDRISGGHAHSRSRGKTVGLGLCLSGLIRRHDGGSRIGVTAILCLSGLPSDLTASILAHEALHAWIKLHPNFSYANPLPLRVEEGLAQLVAFLFLCDGLDPIDKATPPLRRHNSVTIPGIDDIYERRDEARNVAEEDDSSIPWETRLRQYFKFRIETDESMNGEGFRAAARAYAELGMEELLYYVALNRDFPPMRSM